MSITKRIPVSLLACTSCGAPLEVISTGYRCTHGDHHYRVIDDRIVFSSLSDSDTHTDDIVYRIKRFIKKRAPWFFFLLYYTVAICVGPSVSKRVRRLPSHAVIANVGSGARRIDERVINIDLAMEPGVDLVADAYQLPLQSNSVDMIITQSLLEHLEFPNKAIAEMHRVLKKGGELYIVTPFMLGFHSSPNDFYRWTIPGMRSTLAGFSMVDAGVEVGPTGAFVAIAREWLAIALSFNISILYQLLTMVFMILFIPLNIFDFVISRYSMASQIAHSYYFIATKN